MDDADLAFTPALEQARLIRTRVVRPAEVVECYLRRIEELDPRLNAYVTVAGEQARAAAAAAERRLGETPAPSFLGVPISIKDLTDTAGIRSAHGSLGWRDRVPEADAEVVRRLKQAGFIVLGKTNTPEFGMQAVTEPRGFPWACNPWDPERSPGGSSGGAAASVAAGLCAAAEGSDGGGSIRNPAGLCGIFGVKPSRGRVSAAPDPNPMFSVIGPLARTVADGAALLDVMAGYAPGDAFWLGTPAEPFLTEAGREPGRLHIAITTEPFIPGIPVEDAPRQGCEEAAELLAGLGHTVEPGRPDWDPYLTISVAPVYGAELAAEPDLPADDLLHPQTLSLVQMGRELPATAMAATLHGVHSLARRTIRFWDDHDVLLTPTLAITAPRVGEFQDLGRPEGVLRYASMAAFTSPFNLTGQPAVSVPMGVDQDGLPRSVQLVGRPGDEATLIRLAAQIERARPWAGLRPPIS